MQILHNINLKDYNTFHINSIAKNFYIIENSIDLISAFDIIGNNEYVIIGGGSNILLSKEYYHNIVLINNKGIEVIAIDTESADVKVAAGENWHLFLKFLIDNNYYGLENLALIPGKCGAAPVQNIGAYGVEQEHFFLKAFIFDTIKREFLILDKTNCNFAYRHSIFKQPEFKHYIITDVVYRLNRVFTPNINYKELKVLDKSKITAHILYNYISEIRKAKIPYPDEYGNAGSFFKNPFIAEEKLHSLLITYPYIPHYRYLDGYKLSAAWLIEQSEMKGQYLHKGSDAQVSERHSLVLVNRGNAKSEEIIQLSDAIIGKVKDKFDIVLEREVNII